MLNIFKLKTKKTNNKKFKQQFDDYLWDTRHTPPANREWNNSIFNFNSNNNILLPSLDIIVIKIIKSYFYMYRYYMEKSIKFPFIKRWKRRFKMHRFWISKGEMKHTNDKVIITLFIYNGQYNKLLKQLKILKLKIYQKKIKYKFNKIISYLNKRIIKEIFIKLNSKFNNKNLNLSFYYLKILKKYVRKCLRKELIYLKYKQIILLNKLKFTNNLLLSLKKLLTKLYNKKVEFNIISLKNYYLNSSIMSQILLTKIRRNRRKTLKILKSFIRRVKTPVLNNTIFIREKIKLLV